MRRERDVDALPRRKADGSISRDINDQVQTKSSGNCGFMLNLLAVILLLLHSLDAMFGS